MPNDTLRQLLCDELAHRCRNNPAYSLRAMARSLQLSPGHLSRILGGKRRASTETTRVIADKLGLSPNERASLGPKELKPMETLVGAATIDRLYSDWCGMAILELLSCDDFDPDPKWIAKRLNVSMHRVKTQWTTLIDLGFLRLENGKWENRYGEMSLVREKATSKVRRQLIQQRLQLASRAVDDRSFDERDNSFATLSMDRALLGEAKKIFADCRRNLLELAQKIPKKDSVFHLEIAFYPVTHSKKHEELT